MRRFIRDQSLTIVVLGIFVVLLAGQTLTGWRAYDADQRDHGGQPVSYGEYLRTGDVAEATFENWESEFLQMGMYVFLTAFLFQRGSAESRDPDAGERAGDDPAGGEGGDVPWPVRRGGVALALYQNSLSIALLLIFLACFALHAWGGARAYSEEQVEHGGEAVSTLRFMGTSEFWAQSLQNWQSEFLAVGALSVLSIWLRQRGSPESKPLTAPHRQTGED